MELRQLRYFVRIVEARSFSQAAAELGVVTSALSQQISRLEGELATRLLQRTSTGVVPTDAGLAFWRQAQLALRHADDAVRAAQQARLSGHVSVGLAPTTATVLGLPLMQAMRERYPDVRLHLVESLSGDLAGMLNARQIDLAVLFRADAARRWSITPLLDERLFVIGARSLGLPAAARTRLARVAALPLVLPSSAHDLRSLVDSAFARARRTPAIVAEIDGLTMLMGAVAAGLAATIQPGAAATLLPAQGDCAVVEISDAHVRRPNLLVSLSDDELSPAGLAARVVMAEVARNLVRGGSWVGGSLHEA
jgi:LysR family transcriptional regulator, regulatory protein for tcuABC